MDFPPYCSILELETIWLSLIDYSSKIFYGNRMLNGSYIGFLLSTGNFVFIGVSMLMTVRSIYDGLGFNFWSRTDIPFSIFYYFFWSEYQIGVQQQHIYVEN